MITINGIAYLTYDETGDKIGINPSYVPTLVNRGKLVAHKFEGDKHKYIKLNDVDRYLNPLDDITPSNQIDTKPTLDNRLTMLQGGIPNKTFSLADIVALVQSICQGYIGIAQNVAHEYTVALTPITERLLVQTTSKDTDVNNAMLEAVPFANELFPLLRDNQFDPKLVNDLIDNSPLMPTELKNGLKSSLDVLATELGIKSVKSGDLVAHAG